MLLLQLSHIIYYKLWYIIHSKAHKQKYKSSKSYNTNPLDIWYGEVLNKVSSLVLNVLHYLGYTNLFQLFIKNIFFFFFSQLLLSYVWQLTIEIFQKRSWQMPEMSSTFHAIVVLIVLIHGTVTASSTYVFVIHMDWKRNFFTTHFLKIWKKKRQINIYVFSATNLRSTYIPHM